MRAAQARDVGEHAGAAQAGTADPVDPVGRPPGQVLVGLLGESHPLHGHHRAGALREDAGEERGDRGAHRVAHHDQVVAGDRVGEVGDVVEVVHEVVVAAGADPLGVAVAAQVGGDDVVSGGGQRRRDGGEAPGHVEEAVQAEERGAAAPVPLEQVVAEAVRQDLPLGRSGAGAHPGHRLLRQPDGPPAGDAGPVVDEEDALRDEGVHPGPKTLGEEGQVERLPGQEVLHGGELPDVGREGVLGLRPRRDLLEPPVHLQPLDLPPVVAGAVDRSGAAPGRDCAPHVAALRAGEEEEPAPEVDEVDRRRPGTGVGGREHQRPLVPEERGRTPAAFRVLVVLGAWHAIPTIAGLPGGRHSVILSPCGPPWPSSPSQRPSWQRPWPGQRRRPPGWQPEGRPVPASDLVVWNRTIATFRAPVLGVSAADRATRAEARIQELLSRPGKHEVSVKTTPVGQVVALDGAMAFVLSAEDVDPLGEDTLDDVARRAAAHPRPGGRGDAGGPGRAGPLLRLPRRPGRDRASSSCSSGESVGARKAATDEAHDPRRAAREPAPPGGRRGRSSRGGSSPSPAGS